MAVSRDGTLAFQQQGTGWELVLVDADGRGNSEIVARGAFHYPRPSPDGRWIAVAQHTAGAGGDHEIRLLDLASDGARTFATGGENQLPLWTPDSKRIVYSHGTTRNGDLDLYWAPIDGSSEPEALLERPGSQIARALSSDGSLLLFDDVPAEGGGADIWLLPLAGEPQPVIASAADEHSGVLSPDDAWIAYVTDEWGEQEVWVRPLDGPGDASRIANGVGEPIWSPSGTEFYVRDAQGTVMLVELEGSERRPGAPRQFLDGAWVESYWHRGPNYGLTADGETLLMIRSGRSDGAAHLRVVFNWFGELERMWE